MQLVIFLICGFYALLTKHVRPSTTDRVSRVLCTVGDAPTCLTRQQKLVSHKIDPNTHLVLRVSHAVYVLVAPRNYFIGTQHQQVIFEWE